MGLRLDRVDVGDGLLNLHLVDRDGLRFCLGLGLGLEFQFEFGLADFLGLGRLRHGPDAKLLGYMVVMQITINLAQPFFIPFALKQVQLEYAAYFLLIAAPYAARMIAFPLFGQVAHRAGARTLLWIGGIGLIPISGLWMLADNLWLLFLAQFIAGLAWAAYELGTFLMIWETVAHGERTSVMTTFNLANSGANAGGALLGGQILAGLGKDAGAYHTLFALSLVLRLFTLILLVRLQRAQGPPASAMTSDSTATPVNGDATESQSLQRAADHRRRTLHARTLRRAGR